MNQLYLCSINEARYRALLELAALPDLVLTDSIQDATIILADPPKLAPRIEQATHLQWLQSTFAGADALLSKPRTDYILTNVRGIFGPLMSEYVFGQLLTLSRHLPHYRTMQTKMRWSPAPYQGLAGKTMVILGTGSIGTHVASTAKHFGMKTIGVNRSGNVIPGFDKMLTTREIKTALADADVVVSILPSTTETKGILNQETLSACQNAILFNVGRGPAVDEQGLLIAIEGGHIRHAVLDVFCKEPLASSHPFWPHPSITVTPHISAESFPEQVFDIFSSNYRRWHNGESLHFVMDFSLGY
ncbi:D-2-hydroxyacid dehydrogenase [Enterovibrio nigricans]|uniref:Phosphoglycerate dehydrogenase n=1 Tax=Enterovibrio nigricans DSM 22720 TaxID=1121868 RepID=A0A1T4UFQ4_9GAMM|nr:D-2-hydroxyacid dehydrogenase [Enterovibrio nigricans]PKF51128.1 D-2-hydroxyacid dehydrogenase [Enterovibrio nigricans]SKA51291.1 Phosphoglycerate dehydrogenase [Enterovibrio nigricans DSM 22720]